VEGFLNFSFKGLIFSPKFGMIRKRLLRADRARLVEKLRSADNAENCREKVR
jgi:hypothetical protein